MGPSDDLTPGDTLFSADGPDWWNHACLDWAHDKWGLYVEGYKLAADCVVDRVTESATHQDFLVYPAIFLYRQYLELELKGIARDARRLLGAQGGTPSGHKIHGLWDTCKPLIRQVFPDEPTRDLDELGRLIAEFASVDSNAQAFRYPIDSKGQATLVGLDRINIRNTKEVLDKMSVLLGGISAAIQQHLEFKLEMEYEYRDEAGL